MATVRKPSSLAARKMRMAISLRLAASSLRIGFTFLILGRRGLPKLYIVPQPWDETGTVFSMHQMQRRDEPLARMQFEGAALPVESEGLPRPMLGNSERACGFDSLQDTDAFQKSPVLRSGLVRGSPLTPEPAVTSVAGADSSSSSCAFTFAQALALRLVAYGASGSA